MDGQSIHSGMKATGGMGGHVEYSVAVSNFWRCNNSNIREQISWYHIHAYWFSRHSIKYQINAWCTKYVIMVYIVISNRVWLENWKQIWSHSVNEYQVESRKVLFLIHCFCIIFQYCHIIFIHFRYQSSWSVLTV